MHAHALPLIDGLLHAPGVCALTCAPEADLVACAEAVTAALVGSLSTGNPAWVASPNLAASA